MERYYAYCNVCTSGCSGSLRGCEDWTDDHESEYENHSVVVEEEE